MKNSCFARSQIDSQRNALRGNEGTDYGGGDRAGDRVEVSVADSGPGIPEEALEKTFEPFFRLESARDRKTGGTGLGLAIAREIVRLHRGDIDVHSEPGRGVTVTVHLPIEDRATVSKKNS